jgi:hypothetical protein
MRLLVEVGGRDRVCASVKPAALQTCMTSRPTLGPLGNWAQGVFDRIRQKGRCGRTSSRGRCGSPTPARGEPRHGAAPAVCGPCSCTVRSCRMMLDSCVIRAGLLQVAAGCLERWRLQKPALVARVYRPAARRSRSDCEPWAHATSMRAAGVARCRARPAVPGAGV